MRSQKKIDSFFTVAHKRHLIWNRRFIKGLPREKWTKDKILKETKYTNVYRQLDRGSLWMYHVLGEEYLNNKNLKNFLFRLLCYRLCVNIETFEEVGVPHLDNFDPYFYLKRLNDKIVSQGKRTSTNAYLTLGGLAKGLKRSSGLVYCLTYAQHRISDICSSIEASTDPYDILKILETLPGVASFTAYEIYCDLCYLKAIPWTTNDAVNIGPGCLAGIQYMNPDVGRSKKMAQIFLDNLWNEQDEHFNRLGIEFRYTNFLEPVENKLSKRCIEHWCCEMSKYWKQSNNVGRYRIGYDKSKSHPNFTIVDGVECHFDNETYKNFDELSTKSLKESKAFKKYNRTGDFSKKSLIEFALKIQEKIFNE